MEGELRGSQWKVRHFLFRSCWKVRVFFNPSGDVSLSAEDKPPLITSLWGSAASIDEDEDDFEEEEEIEEHHDWLQGHTALKFLMAGGTAGAGERLVSLILA